VPAKHELGPEETEKATDDGTVATGLAVHPSEDTPDGSQKLKLTEPALIELTVNVYGLPSQFTTKA